MYRKTIETDVEPTLIVHLFVSIGQSIYSYNNVGGSGAQIPFAPFITILQKCFPVFGQYYYIWISELSRRIQLFLKLFASEYENISLQEYLCATIALE